MYALCIESSHKRGMGHLYRALNLIELLKKKGERSIVFVNDDTAAIEALKSRGVPFETVDLADSVGGWETSLIKKHGIDVWINDRLDTGKRHAENVKGNNIRLVTFDDRGAGAALSDMNFAALAFEDKDKLKGAKVFSGVEYLVLNKEIERYRRVRKSAEKILVTLGGSDTYGVTVKVVEILKGLNKKADVHVGPSFRHHGELKAVMDESFKSIGRVPSLIEAFYGYGLAVTGGGITPFEANASGLPCIVIANEPFEAQNGRFLEGLGSSIFAGFHEDMDAKAFERELDIEMMSLRGMEAITLDGAENVYRQIRAL